MPDTKQLLRDTRDRIAPPSDVLGGLDRRRRQKDNRKRAAAAVVGIAIALLGLGGWFALERHQAPTPADPSKKLGIFAPIAGRIVYVNGDDIASFEGLSAVDPNGPADTMQGPAIADDVASTLVRLDLEGAEPLGWSSDGTELLFMRSSDDLFPGRYLYILHADGSQTQVTTQPMDLGGATISPDGTRVAFAAGGDHHGLWVVDTEGGQPVPLPLPEAAGAVTSPTFSPDGTQIAYLNGGDVWVINAGGGNAHQILANDATLGLGTGLQWSPAGDRLAVASESTGAITTFAPDGSGLTQVITGGVSPYWSPDGSRIAYTVICDEQCQARGFDSGGLAIADADGSNARTFGFGSSGPWHPGASAERPTPSPEPSSSSYMWPQSSLDEVREAQRLADAGDPRYTWQVDPELHAAETFSIGGAEIFARYLRQELGWQEFRTGIYGFGGSGWLPIEVGDGTRGVEFVRCAPGQTNLLYRNDPQGSGCAPTIDELRYERVEVSVAQPDRRGPSGIWVVTGWRMLPPVEQVVPPSDADATALLEAFLQARIDGAGAREYLLGEEGIPLLYGTTSGAHYERSEIEGTRTERGCCGHTKRVEGPVWPDGETGFKVRLLAEGGSTVVEQFFALDRDENGRLGLTYQQRTTENGQPVAEPYSRLDGEVTFFAAQPWVEYCLIGPCYLDRDVNLRERIYVLADPRPVETGCGGEPAPADAEALARSIRSDPDVEATEPVVTAVGGIEALRMDVVAAPGASVCLNWEGAGVVTEAGGEGSDPVVVSGGRRMRLYLLDLPEGLSARTLAIAIVAPETRFDAVVQAAVPIVDSFQFHAG